MRGLYFHRFHCRKLAFSNGVTHRVINSNAGYQVLADPRWPLDRGNRGALTSNDGGLSTMRRYSTRFLWTFSSLLSLITAQAFGSPHFMVGLAFFSTKHTHLGV